MDEKALAEKKEKRWLPLESNPELLNKYMKALGVTGKLEWVDVLGVDDELLAMVPEDVRAVCLLFPISDASEAYQDEEAKQIKEKPQKISEKLYYMKQVVGNACGTIAVLVGLLLYLLCCSVTHLCIACLFSTLSSTNLTWRWIRASSCTSSKPKPKSWIGMAEHKHW